MLNVGIIGLGGIARWEHIPALTSLPNIKITALCDCNPFKMESESVGGISEKDCIVKKLFEDRLVKKYTDYQKLLSDLSIDAVHICTPNLLHSVIAVEALKMGKHVFCEKPDAINPSEVERMKAAMQTYGKRLTVMRNNRHLASSRYLKKLIEDGALGEIYSVRCGWQRRRGIPGRGGWFTTKELSGGGVLIDLGVHMIDLAVYLMGSPRAVSATGDIYRKFADSAAPSDSEHSGFGETVESGIFDVEDYAGGYVKFENGASLSCEFSWASNIDKEKRYVELKGDKGGALWDDGKVTVYGERYGSLYDEILRSDIDESGHKNAISEFYSALLFNGECSYTIDEGINIIKILSAIYLSAEQKKEIKL